MAATSTSAASLRLADGSPVTLVGRGFGPGEAVRLTVRMGERLAVRRVTAGTRGGIRVVLRTWTYDRCTGLRVLAAGSFGHRAGLRLVPIYEACPPPVAP